MDTVVSFDGVDRSFGEVHAVRGLHLSVPRGEVVGLLGPNGSGKSTTLSMLMGYLVPSAGDVRVFGGPPNQRARQRMGYLPEQRGLYDDMPVLPQLAWFGRLAGLERRAATHEATRWLERMGLADRAGALVSEMSKGMQQRVQLAVALIGQPELLILDEPFSGLDPVSQDMFASVIADERTRGTTVLLCTHVIAHAEASCDRVVLLIKGQKRIDAPVASMVDAQPHRLRLSAAPGDRDALLRALATPIVQSLTPQDDGGWVVTVDPTSPRDALLKHLMAEGCVPASFGIDRRSLHEQVVQAIRDEDDLEWEEA